MYGTILVYMVHCWPRHHCVVHEYLPKGTLYSYINEKIITITMYKMMDKAHKCNIEQKKPNTRVPVIWFYLCNVQIHVKLIYLTGSQNGDYTWGWVAGRLFCLCDNILFLDLSADHMDMFSFLKRIELYNYNIWAFQYVYNSSIQ